MENNTDFYKLSVGDRVKITGVPLRDDNFLYAYGTLSSVEYTKENTCYITIHYDEGTKVIDFIGDINPCPFHWDGRTYTVMTWGFYAFDLERIPEMD